MMIQRVFGIYILLSADTLSFTSSQSSRERETMLRGARVFINVACVMVCGSFNEEERYNFEEI